MFDLGWPEMLVIAIVLIVVVGPKDLPRMLRSFGRTTAKMRTMAGDFRKQFDEALKEAELEDVKSTIDSARKLNPAGELKKALNPMEKAASDLKAGLDDVMKPTAPKKQDATASDKPAETAGTSKASGEASSAGAADAKVTSGGKGSGSTSTNKPAATAKRPAAAAKKPGPAKKSTATTRKPSARKKTSGTAT
ncbi:Sec-independent protein translocase protein TatB [Mesorhizobium xinjiangense]|uniref:Sec-independent protein translocase protein TatB n=1 Tax=Mesorhizobium xinjiangense TaxID=2678685 RepID=UPI0012ED100A|nr:Sec-independent protein translocase protein TatB [Mesorhizobium xinjiangense]